MEDSMEVLNKIKTKLSCDPATPFLGIYTKLIKLVSQRGYLHPQFISAFL
jgi:hypothetical protein